jgi:hypothetical protein
MTEGVQGKPGKGSPRVCSAQVVTRERVIGGFAMACKRTATVCRNGMWWCWQHDPVAWRKRHGL